jgi:hypothetical protein
MTKMLVMVALALAVPAVASADPAVCSPEWPDNDWCDSFVELSAGPAATTTELGRLAVSGRAVAVGVGLRQQARGVHLEYALGLVRLPDGTSGTSHDVALRYRRSLVTIGGGEYSVRRGDAWVDAGIGGQRLQWERGRVTRPALSVGAGLDVDAAPDSHDYLGLRLAVRLTVASTPDDRTMVALCAGSCGATGDRLDLGVLVTAAVVIGK